MGIVRSTPTKLIPVGGISLSLVSPRAEDTPAPHWHWVLGTHGAGGVPCSPPGHPHHLGNIIAALYLHIIFFWFVFTPDLALSHLAACPNACKDMMLQPQELSAFCKWVGSCNVISVQRTAPQWTHSVKKVYFSQV